MPRVSLRENPSRHAQQIPEVEYAEIVARDLGFDARVFGNEEAATLWLRHGAQ